MASIGLGLKKFCTAHGPTKTADMLRESMVAGKITKNDIHIRELAENMVGPNWSTVLAGRWQGMREAVEAVDASGFAAITGQLLVQEIKEKYNSVEFIGDQLMRTVPITNGNLGPQRVPFLSDVVDAPVNLQPLQPYPATTFLAQYIDMPAPQKWGEICLLSAESVFADLTHQMYDSAGSCGYRTRLAKEERQLQVVLGIGPAATYGQFSWNGTTYSTYLTSGAWINQISGNLITDWTGLNAIEILAQQMLDPVTLKPIQINLNTALVMPAIRYTWAHILHATSVQTGPYATTGSPAQIRANNTLDLIYPTLFSKNAYHQLVTTGGLSATQANQYVLLGDFQKAFEYREVYPMRTVEAPPQNPWEFNQDVIFALKTQEMGVPCVRDPRYVFQSYNT
jgi:hypothetical protein